MGLRILSKSSRGFTLIEVLVAVLILSVGLLGLAGLQARALQSTGGSQMRTFANQHVYDILDRMRSNWQNAGDYVVAIGDDLSTSTVTGLPLEDMQAWKDAISLMPGPGDGSIAVDLVSITAPPVIDVTITVQWLESGVTEQIQVESRL